MGFGLFLLAYGCDAGYYWHLAQGQARIVWNCQSLEDLLARAALDSTRQEQFRLIQEIRQYGFEQIGLKKSSSYTCFCDTGDRPISWNLSACPPDRFEPYRWRFPIVGAVPYKGFFALERALREGQRLQSQGYDVALRPVAAYSTLGYFADPILSTMLDDPVDDLAELILHELTHGTVYARGQTEFNESLATFVGQVGSLEFLAYRFGANHPLIDRTRQKRRDEERFRTFMAGVVAALDSLYQLGLPQETVLVKRREVFAQAKEEYRRRRSQFEYLNCDDFLTWEVNNARLLSYQQYHCNLELFEAVFTRNGRRLKDAFAVFKACGEAADPWHCLSDSAAALPEPPDDQRVF